MSDAGDPQYPYYPPPPPTAPSPGGPPPNYPPPIYPPTGYPPTGGPPPPREPRGRLPRMLRRPAPRLGISFAGVGVAVAVVGVIVWAGDYLAGSGAGDNGPSDSHRLLGVGLSLVTIAIGYLLAVRVRRGPLATAGAVAAALGVPVLLGFLTFTTSSSDLFPFSIDAVALLSIAAWLVSYAVVPGASGRAFYLGLASTVLWVYILDKAEPSALNFGALIASSVRSEIGIQGGGGGPHWSTVAGLSIFFGLGYYVVMGLLDNSGRAGSATPFAVSGFLAMVVGIAATGPSWHASGVGALLIVFGALLGALGARTGRRFTTWAWAAAVGVGIVVIIGDELPDNNAGAGITLIICGLVLVGVGLMAAMVLSERPDDTAEAVSGVH